MTLFSGNPMPDDAIYFGFETDLSRHLLYFFFQCEKKNGTNGIDVTRPPYKWEGASRDDNGDLEWLPCDLSGDETKGMLEPGRMMVHVPTLHQMPIPVWDEHLFWVRLRVFRENEYPAGKEKKEFNQSPKVQQVTVRSMGGTVTAQHAEVVNREFLGYSDGTPGQQFYLQSTPILRPDVHKDETLCVVPLSKSANEQPVEERWVWVPDFGGDQLQRVAQQYTGQEEANEALTNRKIFTLDTASGELQLPPALTDSSGNVQRYGHIPERGAALWFNKYRHGGGVIGNVEAYALDTLKTAVPYVNHVYNRKPAVGGQDQEPLEMAKLRAPHLLHAQNRAVTAADFEYLATRADVAVGRVKCLQHEPGWVASVDPGTVYLFVLPKVKDPAKPLTKAALTMPKSDRDQIASFLDQRRLLTMRLQVDHPEIIWAWVQLTCRLVKGANKKEIEQAIQQRLYSYLNPLIGGPQQAGWPFGRDLYTYDVYTCLQGVPDILMIPEISLFRSLPAGRERVEKDALPVPPHGVLALAGCDVRFVR